MGAATAFIATDGLDVYNEDDNGYCSQVDIAELWNGPVIAASNIVPSLRYHIVFNAFGESLDYILIT